MHAIIMHNRFEMKTKTVTFIMIVYYRQTMGGERFYMLLQTPWLQRFIFIHPSAIKYKTKQNAKTSC